MHQLELVQWMPYDSISVRYVWRLTRYTMDVEMGIKWIEGAMMEMRIPELWVCEFCK